jgi:DNA phosphorothioation-associated putative methyltransferase
MRLAIEDGLISEKTRVFDYGCGLGGDVQRLRDRGIKCWGWDPVHAPRERLRAADVVNLGYVANVIERADERSATLRKAWKLAEQVLVVAARLTIDARGALAVFEDGHVTRLGTFQKYFDQTELRTWIDVTLDVTSVPTAPGVFYVFRDDGLRERFVAARYQRRIATPRIRRSEALFEEHRPLFETLQGFLVSRGRLPSPEELPEARLIQAVLGSLPRAFSILRRVTAEKEWDKIRETRSQDLLLYLALARFDGRPMFSRLPREMQLDVRAFFGTYAHAGDEADKLLFLAGSRAAVEEACRSAPVGKLTPTALYVHESALADLTPVLRVYEGCASRYLGSVRGANIIKLHRDGVTVSYLSYPRFEQDPHPALAAALTLPLQTFRVTYRDFRDSENPPVLHRKEQFLGTEHPLRAKFARLTAQEERLGLYEMPELIGTLAGWRQALEANSVVMRGHRAVRSPRRSA